MTRDIELLCYLHQNIFCADESKDSPITAVFVTPPLLRTQQLESCTLYDSRPQELTMTANWQWLLIEGHFHLQRRNSAFQNHIASLQTLNRSNSLKNNVISMLCRLWGELCLQLL